MKPPSLPPHTAKYNPKLIISCSLETMQCPYECIHTCNSVRANNNKNIIITVLLHKSSLYPSMYANYN